MNQQTRHIIADVLLGISMLIVVVFVATHFMAPPRPAWRHDAVSIGLLCAITAGLVRGRPSWRSARQAD